MYLEYEYIVTNDDLDVDKIIAKKKRKRMLSISCKDIEKIAPVENAYKNEMNAPSIKQAIDVCESASREASYFILFENEKGKGILYLDAPDEMISMLRRYIPTKVTLRG